MSSIKNSLDSNDVSSEGSGKHQVSEQSLPPLRASKEDENENKGAPNVTAPTSSVNLVTAGSTDKTSKQNEESATVYAKKPDQKYEQARTNAAGIAAGIMGLLVGGPILALIAGFGAFYKAMRHDNTTGDAARALGDFALTARDKANELDKKHHVVDKTKAAAGRAQKKAEDLAAKYDTFDNLKGVLAVAYKRAVAFDEKHHIVEQTSNTVITFFRFASTKLTKRAERLNNAAKVH